MKRQILFPFLSLVILPCKTQAQTVFSNGGIITITQGGIMHSNGGFTLESSSVLMNNGDLKITKNSVPLEAGNFHIGNNASSSGNGFYRIEQNWINDGIFNCDASTTELYGDTEQLITSNNGTVTEFCNLTLLGNGTLTDRRKTLSGVDARSSTTGILNLNDRELNTTNKTFTVLNNSSTAVLNNTSFGNEGFVSSLEPGFLIRSTNSTSTYVYPLGSSEGIQRYRPVRLTPENNTNNQYAGRFNNYNADVDGYFLAQHDQDIESANSLFYHSIEQISGNSNARLAIAYLENDDGTWSNLANWTPSNSLWSNMGDVNNLNQGNYQYLEKNAWNIINIFHPHILVNINEDLIVPNVFTPNGDGVNEAFFVTSKGIKEYNITIVNRWGNPVYESTDVNASWDGTSNGNKCVDGTYFYIINAKSATKEYKKQGHVTLNGN